MDGDIETYNPPARLAPAGVYLKTGTMLITAETYVDCTSVVVTFAWGFSPKKQKATSKNSSVYDMTHDCIHCSCISRYYEYWLDQQTEFRISHADNGPISALESKDMLLARLLKI